MNFWYICPVCERSFRADTVLSAGECVECGASPSEMLQALQTSLGVDVDRVDPEGMTLPAFLWRLVERDAGRYDGPINGRGWRDA
jgi:hypothetical protein